MATVISVRQAEKADVKAVAQLVHALLCELSSAREDWPSRVAIETVTERLLQKSCGVWAFLAFDKPDAAVGVLTLSECCAIYAGGKFGKISELYVTPESRSDRVGARLLEAATVFGKSKQWGRLEVGAPDVPRWNRTVSFYLDNGFVEVGPRLKLTL